MLLHWHSINKSMPRGVHEEETGLPACPHRTWIASSTKKANGNITQCAYCDSTSDAQNIIDNDKVCRQARLCPCCLFHDHGNRVLVSPHICYIVSQSKLLPLSTPSISQHRPSLCSYLMSSVMDSELQYRLLSLCYLLFHIMESLLHLMQNNEAIGNQCWQYMLPLSFMKAICNHCKTEWHD